MINNNNIYMWKNNQYGLVKNSYNTIIKKTDHSH